MGLVVLFIVAMFALLPPVVGGLVAMSSYRRCRNYFGASFTTSLGLALSGTVFVSLQHLRFFSNPLVIGGEYLAAAAILNLPSTVIAAVVFAARDVDKTPPSQP